ncbi:MAG: translation initiation factor eIF-2B [Nanoarchaeota archaeon]|nr:translation initiation factor eIF-2B [Nanoarchaeota archaeon]
MDNKKRFESITKDIKSIKIQGARNIAKAALKAYSLFPDEKHKKILISLRPTEPMLWKVLDLVDKKPMNEIVKHFDEAQQKINQSVIKIIRNNSKIFTHCHSTNVVNALIYAKKHGKKFEVFNTETRPLFQGRKTAKELSKAKIKTTLITDLEIGRFLKDTDVVFLGSDALLKNGDVINKIGSAMISELASNHKIPVYIIADSWKFSAKDVKIEERTYKEVWKNAPRDIKIKNLSFEKVPSKYLKAIISELGILKPKDFVKKVK